MEVMKVCRICLILDVKLHDLRSYPLESYYGSVIGTNSQYSTLPPYACYECAALVRKFYFFRQKCLRSQAVLFGTLDDYGELNCSEVRSINRKGLHIASNLNITTLPDLEICPEQQHKTQIKEENHESNSKNNLFIGDHNYAALYSEDPSLSNNDNNPKSHPEEISLNTALHVKSDSEEEQEVSHVKTDSEEEQEVSHVNTDSEEEQEVSHEKVDSEEEQEVSHVKTDSEEEQEVSHVKTDSEEEQEVSHEKVDSEEEQEVPLFLEIDEDTNDVEYSIEVPKVVERKRIKNQLRKAGNRKKKLSNQSLEVPLFLELAEDDDVEHLIEVPKVVERKGIINQPRKTRKRRRKLSSPSSTAESKNDLEYITVTTLSLEEQKEEIQKRKESTNYLNSPFKCNLCYKGFVRADAFDHHVRKHSESAGSIECEVCKFRFKTRRIYNKHVTTHEKKYTCDLCSYVTISIPNAKQHQAWHKGITYKCKYCDEIFSKWTTYMAHLRIKHPSQFICGYCGYSFVSKLGLAMHKTLMHKGVHENTEENVEEGPYCEECDVKFRSTEAYNRHMVMSAKHTPSTDSIEQLQPTRCQTCGAAFKNYDELREHRKEHTRLKPKNHAIKPNINTNNFHCKHCPEEFHNTRDYWHHFRRAHPNETYPMHRTYVCDICGKGYMSPAFLRYHRRTHFERAFKCSQCDKAFHNRGPLVNHERSHSENRPFTCAICFKSFKIKPALKRHVLSHTGEKPYECELCGRRFTQSGSKKVHLRTVHQKLPGPRRNRPKRRPKKPIT